MGLFDFLKKKEKENASTVSTTSSTINSGSVTTDTNNASSQPMKIDMSKHQENLEKVVINMSKNSKVDMTKHTARVAVAMDYSGSMDLLYKNGSVQNTITRLLPLGLKFDDNGEVESWLFSNDQEHLDTITIHNYSNYVKKVMKNASMRMGGTNYAPVLKDIKNYYEKKHPSTIPTFVIFITDGENWDTSETDQIIRELSNYNIFIQFIGIGNESFNYLRKLDNLSGRKKDNTGFIAVEDMDEMDDNELYTELLSQYKDWLNK